jgi:hypothetical protein
MKRLLLPLLFVCATLPLFADLEIEPHRIFAGDEVVVHIRGFWDGLTLPKKPVVSIEGTTITIDLVATPQPPISAGGEWALRVPIGHLAAGFYQVVVVGRQVESQTFIVEGGPFRVFRTLTASREPGVLIRGVAAFPCDPRSFGCTVPTVTFNGVASPHVIVTEEHDIIAAVPENGSGAVDVGVWTKDGDLLVLHSGYAYGVLLNEEDDYERVLFPLNYIGRGAHGADWRTDIVVRNDGPVYMETVPQFWIDPSDPEHVGIVQPIPPGERAAFPPRLQDGGAFLYVPRGLEPFLSYSAHVVDRSRLSEGAGTELPVVRARDTASTIRILDVPRAAGYRAMLRIYDWDLVDSRDAYVKIKTSEGVEKTLAVHLPGTGICPNPSPRPPCFAPSPSYRAIDLSAISGLGNAKSFDVTVTGVFDDARLWAFVSITNNATQQVTTYTPQ